MKRTFKIAGALALSLAFAQGAMAEDFFGFDPEKADGRAFDAAAIAKMVEAAEAVTPPRNGEKYVFAYTMWGGNSTFSNLNRVGIEAFAKQGGLDIIVADNEWNPQKNIANTQSFARRNVDFVFNSLLDVNLGPSVRAPLAEAGIRMMSFDIPVANEFWLGTNNARVGFKGGTHLANAAIARWGIEAVEQGYLVVSSFPVVGANGLIRNLGQEAGFRSLVPNLPDENVFWVDGKATPEGGFASMNDLKQRLDPKKPLMIVSFSDEQLAGALQAIHADGRSDMTMAVGMGGGRLDAVASDDSFIATVSVTPSLYANYALPAALMHLAGRELPAKIFIDDKLVTPANVCKFDTEQACSDLPKWQPKNEAYDEAAFANFVNDLYGRDDLKDFQVLLPSR